MIKERNNYFDFLRGIAIIMVVGIHTSGNYLGFNTTGCFINTTIRQFLNAGVPIFFAISGFFLSHKDLSNYTKRINFWRRQILKVYLPALFWGFPWLLLAAYTGESIIRTIILWLCCGLSVLYFIAVIIQDYLLLPIIQKFTPPYQVNGIETNLLSCHLYYLY